MASRSCPNCGTIVPATSQFCRNCGVPFATGMNGGEATPPQPPTVNPPLPYRNPEPGYSNPQPPYGNPQPGYGGMPPSSMPSVPPYGGPPAFNANAPWQTANVWRQKNQLVMHKEAALPDRCVKCNRSANGRKLTKKYMWHHPAWFLFIFLGVLIYLIIALIVRKPVTLHLGLCDEHFSKRRIAIGVSWLLVLLSIGLIILGVSQNSPVLALLGIPLIFIAVVYGALSASVIAIQKVDDHYVWLKRINKDYLAMLPELP